MNCRKARNYQSNPIPKAPKGLSLNLCWCITYRGSASSEWMPVTGFLEKPVDFDVLLDKVAKLLGEGSEAD